MMEIANIILALVLSILIAALLIPPIIRVSNAKLLFACVDSRTVHSVETPTLGGVAIFIAFIISFLVSTKQSVVGDRYLLVAVILMFFIGLKDDVLVISAYKKLIVQIVAALLLVLLGNFRILSFGGLFGIEELNYVVSCFFSIFLILLIVNAFNLIDGIDGLASGIGMFVCLIFGIWFYISGHSVYAIVSFSLVGSLAGFFLYNVFGHRNKVFMGDTGALVVGIIIAALVIKFCSFNLAPHNEYVFVSAPAIVFSIILFPLIDTLRIILIRLMQKKSPFSPDKNHIHHRLLVLCNNHHLTTTATILLANCLVVAFTFWLEYLKLDINATFFIVFILGTILAQMPGIIINIRNTAVGSTVKKMSLKNWFL